MKRFLVGGCAALLVAACSQDPSLYLGGPAGPVTRIQLSAGQVPMTVGQTVTVGAAALDEVGNVSPELPAFTSCGGPVTVSAVPGYGSYSAAADISAAPATVGVTCVLASAGGVTDSIRISVGPAGITILGPDTVVSGLTGQFTAVLYNAAGDPLDGNVPLAWSSANEGRMITTFEGGLVSGRAPGSVNIQVRAPNGVIQTRTVIIKPDLFTGTLSAATGNAGDLITATRGPGDSTFDADANATVGGQVAFVEVTPPSSMRIAIPATGTAGVRDLDILSLGAVQLAKRTTFTTTTATDDIFGTTTEDPATAPDYLDVRSPGNWVYFTHSGYGTGGGSRGVLNGGTREDHYFLITTGAANTTLSEVRLEWTNGGTAPTGGFASDFDVYVCPVTWGGDYDQCAAQLFSGATTNEVGTSIRLNANTTYFVAASAWTARSNIHNFRLRITGTAGLINP
jgi:hypothetical protein